MKNNADTTKDQTPKTQPAVPKEPATKVKAPKTKKEPAAKVEKAAKADTDAEPVDRLPASVEELKESKSGLVTYLFLSGKAKEDIAKELQATFKVAEAQAAKIVRRITGRARLFQRSFALTETK